MTTLTDIWGNDVEITHDYVSYRNRLIDINQIQTFHAKGKRLYINTFKQNTYAPTMCIFFDNKEKACEAFQVMREVNYGPAPLSLAQKGGQPSLSSSEMLVIFLTMLSPLFVFLFTILAFSFFPLIK